MTEFLSGWTVERVTLLAPDAVSAQSGRKLANPRDDEWQAVASDGYSAWGVFQSKRGNIHKIQIDLLKLQHGDHVWACNCRTHKSPCKHILALLYILVDEPEFITQASPPHWVTDWLDKEAISARKREERKKRQRTITPEKIEQRQKQFAKRKQNIDAGLQELEQWLINIIRRGLADPQIRSYDFWDTRAARLVDAQAPGIATWLKAMGSIPAKGTDWIEPLLDQLGRLYLLIESFKRYDDLSPEIQADLRSVVGWHLKRDETVFFDTVTMRDHWVVTGRYSGMVQSAERASQQKRGLKTQRIWLRGMQSGRDALLLEFAFGDSLFDSHYNPSVAIDAELTFYPSRYPLRAFIDDQDVTEHPAEPIVGDTILENIENYAHALSQNPWLLQYPFVLDNVIPVHHDNQWILREVDGTYLPLSEEFQANWELLALSGGHPIQVSGEWDGSVFHPTGAMDKGRYIDFEIIGKVQ
ncbi:MAG: SWIM zinc finger family protein [Chloroflexota bacterium]